MGVFWMKICCVKSLVEGLKGLECFLERFWYEIYEEHEWSFVFENLDKVGIQICSQIELKSKLLIMKISNMIWRES